MKVRFSPQARADLDAIFTYINERSPAAAARVNGALRDLIYGLADFPLIGLETDVAGVRSVVAGRLPYRIFYRPTDSEVIVLHVRHTSRAEWHEGRPD